MSDKGFDVAVIGEGVSGLTAAGQLAERGFSVATFERELFGGLVLNVNELRPGLQGEKISGSELTSGMMERNLERGVSSVQEQVTAIEPQNGRWAIVTTGGRYIARQVILAAGARLKKLGVPGEEEYAGRGVSHCASCDGPMNVGTPVVVVGGGDSALQEALVLAEFASKVVLVHRRGEFRGREEFARQVLEHPKIEVFWSATVRAIGGDKVVRHVQVVHGDGRREQVACTGFFAYIGLQPNTEGLASSMESSVDGHVVTNERMETSLPGIWAVGAVRSGYGGELTHAVAEATAAAKAVAERLAQPV